MIESKFNFRLFYLFIYFVNEIESFRNEKREFPRPREITEEKNFMIDCTFTRHKEEFSFGWQTVNFPVNIDDIVRAKNACVYIYTHRSSSYLSSLSFNFSYFDFSRSLKKKKKEDTNLFDFNYPPSIAPSSTFLDRYFPQSTELHQRKNRIVSISPLKNSN